MSPIDRLLLHSRLLPRTIRLGARNLVRNKRRTAATILQISLAVATALGFLNMAISFGRELDKDFAVIDWDASMYAPAGAPGLDRRRPSRSPPERTASSGSSRCS